MNNFLLTLAILTQLTGLTLPQVLGEQLYILPTYAEDNVLALHAKTAVNDLPTKKRVATPRAINLDWGPDNLQASAAIVADAATGQILWQKNENAQFPVASLTKLMTVLVFMDRNPGWEHKQKITAEDNSLIGAKLHIANDQELTTHDLLRTTLVGSANNTAQALAHSTGLSDEGFKKVMNKKAELLGLENTHFVEPTGLEENNKSSAADLAVIFKNVIQYQDLRKAMALEEHWLEVPPDNHVHKVKTTNKLIKDEELNVLGGKTGFTYEAGYCLITLASNKQGNEIIVAVLGLPDEESRDAANKELIQWTFNNYTWR